MKESAAIIISVIFFSLATFLLCNKIETNVKSVVSLINESNDCIIILDAGHGGEDGGCVAYDNTLEKDINLRISENIALYFDLFGYNYRQIRTEDISIGDINLPTIRERKISDIKNRFQIINSYPDSILLSIHQNMYSVEKYYGTQVFYAGSVPESNLIAQHIQSSVTKSLQPENSRQIKSADENIYLLDKAIKPSVMVECGFLSNFAELEKLKTSEYQSQISYFIFKGLNNYCNTKEK